MSKKTIGERLKRPWGKMPIAGIMTQQGSAEEYRTGDWRIATKPVINNDKCIMCLFCWIFCPDASITRTEGRVEVDYYHCKGCGICSVECPVKAIERVSV